MICYNCPLWLPRNRYSVDGTCLTCGAPTRADTECFDPIPDESEVATDEAL